MNSSGRLLVKVATKNGHAAFWLDEVLSIADSSDGCFIRLAPVLGQDRYIESAWGTERVLKAIEETRS